MNDLSGQSIGRYHIIEPLGEGGMAVVYKAYDTRLECDVAVKFIRTDQLAPAVLERTLKRFEREAKSVAQLTHPNIVKVTDYGEHEGVPYLVMAYYPEGTLKERMIGPVGYGEAARLLVPIARGLEYAHGRNVVHRDVKPSNILMTESGEPMLTDFGIAKILDLKDGQTLTAAGMGVGTPEYMAPEQGMGSDVDGRADIYALGIVFYELITGRTPYKANTPMAVLLQSINDPLPRPSEFVKGIPKQVEQVLYKALAKNPKDRYANMREFVRVLEDLGKNAKEAAYAGIGITRMKEPLEPELKTTDTGEAIQPPDEKKEETPRKEKKFIKKRNIWIGVGFGLIALAAFAGIIYFKPYININKLFGVQDQTAVVSDQKGDTQLLEAQDLIAFVSDREGGTQLLGAQDQIAFVSDREGGPQLFTMNPNGINQKQISAGSGTRLNPSWSPDRTKIAYSNGADIYVMNANRRDGQKALQNAFWDMHPSWSPDGKKIAYATLIGGKWGISSFGYGDFAPGGDPFSYGDVNDTEPAWSPDGKKIAFTSGSINTNEIYIVNIDGTNRIRLTQNDFYDSEPAWSPDGEKIAFSTYRNGDWEIFVMDADGANPVNLTNNIGSDKEPTWSPDGRKIAFTSERDGNREIYVMNADGTGQKNITNNPGNDYQPAWASVPLLANETEKVSVTAEPTFPTEMSVPNSTIANEDIPNGAIFLSKLVPLSSTVGYGIIGVGITPFNDIAENVKYGSDIVHDKVIYKQGIFAHAPSQIEYQLGGEYSKIHTGYFLDSRCGSVDGVIFKILADGTEVFTSGIVHSNNPHKEIDVNINKAENLTLITDPGVYNDNQCDWSVWGNPYLIK